MIGNAVLGLLTCYFYLYFWIMFSFASTIFSFKALIGVIVPLTLVGIFNGFIINDHYKQGWITGLATYVGTIVLFIVVFAFV